MCASLYTAPLDRRLAKLTCAERPADRRTVERHVFSMTAGCAAGLSDVMARDQTGDDVREFLQHGAVHSRFAAIRQTRRRTGRCRFGKIPLLRRTPPARRCGKSTGANGGLVRQLERRVALECDCRCSSPRPRPRCSAAKVPEAAAKIVGISNGVDHRYFDPSLGLSGAVRSDAADVRVHRDDGLQRRISTRWSGSPPRCCRAFAGAARSAVLYRWQQPGRGGKTPRVAGRCYRHRPGAGCPALRVSCHRRGRPDADRSRHPEQGVGSDGHGQTRHRHVRRARGHRRDTWPGGHPGGRRRDVCRRRGAPEPGRRRRPRPRGWRWAMAARRLILQRYDWDACLSGFDASDAAGHSVPSAPCQRPKPHEPARRGDRRANCRRDRCSGLRDARWVSRSACWRWVCCFTPRSSLR